MIPVDDDPLEHVKKMRADNSIFVIFIDSLDDEKIEVCRKVDGKKTVPMFCAIKRGLDTSAIDSLRWTAKFYFDDHKEAPFVKAMIDSALMTYKHNREKQRWR